jgi:transcriptional regulator with XRE-family HTH domain
MRRAYPNLKTFMEQTGATQQDVASRVRASQAQISRILARKAEPGLRLAIALSEIGNFPIETLVREAGHEPR